MSFFLRLFLLLSLTVWRASAADSGTPRIDFEKYNPKSTLVVPDAVLKKIYFENAIRIIPGIDRSLFPR